MSEDRYQPNRFPENRPVKSRNRLRPCGVYKKRTNVEYRRSNYGFLSIFFKKPRRATSTIRQSIRRRRIIRHSKGEHHHGYHQNQSAHQSTRAARLPQYVPQRDRKLKNR